MNNAVFETPENPLAKNFTPRTLLEFVFPSIFMMIFMGLYTIGDTVIISRFVHTDALSALNIVTPVINVIVGLGTMFATGCSAIAAKKMGEGRGLRASQDFTLIALSAAVLGVIVALSGILFIDKIIWGLGASGILFPYCKQYLFLLLLFTPASLLQGLFQTLIVAAGKPAFGMILSISAGILNVLLDYLFVVPLKMGIAGAALGTGIGYMVQMVTGIVFFAGTGGTLRFCKPVIDLHVIKESCSNGFSELVSQIAAAVTTFLFNITMMRLLGENGVAAITIIIYTQFLLTSLYIGFSMGVAPVISYNFGCKSEHLKKVFRICLLFVSILSVTVFAAALLLASPLVSVFSSKGTPVYQIARQGFLVFPFSFLFCGFNIFASALFTALSNGKISALISSLRTFVFICAALLLLPRFFGVTGVWVAVPLAELLTASVSFALILKNRKTYAYL